MSDKHNGSIDLTEKALEKFAQGDEQGGNDLVSKANQMDPSGPKEVLSDLDEDQNDRKKQSTISSK